MSNDEGSVRFSAATLVKRSAKFTLSDFKCAAAVALELLVRQSCEATVYSTYRLRLHGVSSQQCDKGGAVHRVRALSGRCRGVTKPRLPPLSMRCRGVSQLFTCMEAGPGFIILPLLVTFRYMGNITVITSPGGL